jgi:hypothetical protein
MIDMIPRKASRCLSAGTMALVLIVLSTVVRAQALAVENNNPAAQAAEAAIPLTPADKKFIKDASESLYLELAIVDVALRRNRPVGVTGDTAKKVGDKLHPDLTKIWEELSTFAKLKKEKLQDELTGVDKREVEQLRAVDIEKFNKQVVALLGKETKKLAQIFDSKSIQHPVLKKLTERYSPALKEHMNEVAQAGR